MRSRISAQLTPAPCSADSHWASPDRGIDGNNLYWLVVPEIATCLSGFGMIVTSRVPITSQVNYSPSSTPIAIHCR